MCQTGLIYLSQPLRYGMIHQDAFMAGYLEIPVHRVAN